MARQRTSLDYDREIALVESREGPFAPELAELLSSLGDFHQRRGEHDLALQAFARAEHIGRINHGLFSPRHIPHVERMIDSLVALGRIEEADDKHHYLLYLSEKCYGREDLRTLPALTRLAGWNMELYRDYLRLDGERSLVSTSPFATMAEIGQLASLRLEHARRAWITAINTLERQQVRDGTRLLELERSLVESYFLEAHQEDILHRGRDFLHDRGGRPGEVVREQQRKLESPAYSKGVDAYRRIARHVLQSPGGNARDYVDALLGLADWQLLFHKPGPAHSGYREAHAFLASLNVADETIDGVLRPAVPVILPAFGDNLHNASAQGSPQGFVDVAYLIDRNGSAGGIEILDRSGGTPGEVEEALKREILRARFRPRYDGGQVLKSERVELRYYYRY